MANCTSPVHVAVDNWTRLTRTANLFGVISGSFFMVGLGVACLNMGTTSRYLWRIARGKKVSKRKKQKTWKFLKKHHKLSKIAAERVERAGHPDAARNIDRFAQEVHVGRLVDDQTTVASQLTRASQSVRSAGSVRTRRSAVAGPSTARGADEASEAGYRSGEESWYSVDDGDHDDDGVGHVEDGRHNKDDIELGRVGSQKRSRTRKVMHRFGRINPARYIHVRHTDSE